MEVLEIQGSSFFAPPQNMKCEELDKHMAVKKEQAIKIVEQKMAQEFGLDYEKFK